MQWRDDTTLPTAALRDFSPLNVRYGFWLCENSSARRARRNISKKLRIMESNDAARAMFGTLFENYIFYILPMYEFLHSQGHFRLIDALPPLTGCALRSKSGHTQFPDLEIEEAPEPRSLN